DRQPQGRRELSHHTQRIGAGEGRGCWLGAERGELLPGASRTGIPPSTPSLPAAIEQAAVEQLAYWFQNRDKVGVARFWRKGGTFEQFQDLDLLPAVRAVLRLYTRWTI